MEILYTSNSIHSKVKKIFSSPSSNDRRVAIVAFIGQDVKSFLPSPKGMLIICNPNPLATSVEAILSLKKKGADVRFSDSLHMKVYYSKERGCIISSANLSNNALGSGNLKEAGVFLPSKNIDIEKLIEITKPYEITNSKLIEMNRKANKVKNALRRAGHGMQKETTAEFNEWYLSSRILPWKLCYYEEEEIPIAEEAIDLSYNNYGKRKPESVLCFGKSQIKSEDWILCFSVGKNSKISTLLWMYIDFVVSVEKGEKAYNKNRPFQAVQVSPLSKYAAPPFKLNRKFINAFNKAIDSYGINNIKKRNNLIPSAKLVDLIFMLQRENH